MELSLETHVLSGQLAVHGLAILLGRNEAGISNRGKKILHHAVLGTRKWLREKMLRAN